MSRTVTALFDSRSEAEAAKARLTSSSIDADNVRIIDKSSGGSGGTTTGGSGDGQGFWASLKEAFLPDEDRQAYGEGISRGGYMICAQVDEDRADEAIRILDESESVDFDQRQQDWRNDGWSGYNAEAGAGAFGTGSTSGDQFGADSTTGFGTTTGTTAGMTGGNSFSGQERSQTVSEENIPIVEEELRIGKREVSRGGARVRSYVREVPVHEQVSLREEHVSVERRPVTDGSRSADLDADDLLRERNIDMSATAEEAVVSKEARVTEEVVVRKTAEQRLEEVEDTVRRTEVDIDEDEGGASDRSAFGGFGGGTTGSSQDRENERTDFERTDRDKSGF